MKRNYPSHDDLASMGSEGYAVWADEPCVTTAADEPTPTHFEALFAPLAGMDLEFAVHQTMYFELVYERLLAVLAEVGVGASGLRHFDEERLHEERYFWTEMRIGDAPQQVRFYLEMTLADGSPVWRMEIVSGDCAGAYEGTAQVAQGIAAAFATASTPGGEVVPLSRSGHTHDELQWDESDESEAVIYLVRWPDLSASLVRAHSDLDLMDVLDEIGNADGCEWEIYDGPLFIDLVLPVEWSLEEAVHDRPLSPEQITVEDVSKLLGTHPGSAFDVQLSSSETGWEMRDEILRRAFPILAAAVDVAQEEEDLFAEVGSTEEQLRELVGKELSRVIMVSWKDATLARRDDPVAVWARERDLPVELAEHYLRKLLDRPDSDE